MTFQVSGESSERVREAYGTSEGVTGSDCGGGMLRSMFPSDIVES